MNNRLVQGIIAALLFPVAFVVIAYWVIEDLIKKGSVDY